MTSGTEGITTGPSPADAGQAGTDLAERLLHFYAAGLRPEHTWQQALPLLASLLGTDKAMYVRIDRTHPRDSLTEVGGVSPEQAAALRNRNLNEDPIWRPLVALPVGRVFRSTELLPIEVIRAGPLYETVSRPAGLEYGVGAILENNARYFSVVGCLRADADFTDADKAALQSLLPHLQLMQEISTRLAAADAGRREAMLSFDQVNQAMIVLDRSGYAIYCNESARRLLDSATGMEIKFGRFVFDGVATQSAFEQAIRTVINSTVSDSPAPPQELRVPRRGQGSPYALTVLSLRRPYSRALLPEEAGCVVLLYDHDGIDPLPVRRLTWLYRLTPAEARICESLHQTASIDATAQLLHLTHHTIRSHLKSIYSKVGVATQPQLLQRLANAAQHSIYDRALGLS